jgi:hypothetical protein
VSAIPNNLGMVIKATKLDAFETMFQKIVESEQHANKAMQSTPQSSAADG